MSQPRFTFCIPNLNKIEYLPDCIQGMLAQHAIDWCCVFVDGNSTDGSWEYMQQFSADPRFKLLRGRGQGMYEDWNECLRHVETEYFYFLTSDDTCFPKLVSSTVAALDAYPQIDVCHFLYAFIDANGEMTHTPEQVIESNFSIYQEPNRQTHIRSGLCEFILHFVYRSIYRTMTSLVMRKRLIDRLQGFSSQYGSAGDFDWTMRLCLETDVLFLPELLATWRLYEAQATQLAGDEKLVANTMAVAFKNLDYLLNSDREYAAHCTIDPANLRSRLYDDHAAAILRSVGTGDWGVDTQQVLKLLQRHPLYIVRKLLNRALLPAYRPYYGNDEFALRFIAQCQLDWPPKPMRLAASCH
jgi:glycosyltransferase involved in cell wall biosynthesis